MYYEKILLLLVASMAVASVNAQFALTSTGFKMPNGDNKDYLIVECANKTQQELFNAVQVYVNKTYNLPNVVLSNVSNEMITISAESEIGVGKALGMYDAVVDYKYKIFVSFKDGKIKIDTPVVSFPYEATNMGGRSREVNLCGKSGMQSVSIFSQDGKLREKDAKETIEKDIDNIVKGISESIKTDANDNW